MIEYIRGEIVELSPAQMVIECAGIGYGLNISLTTYSAFDKCGEGKVYVHEVIREDAHLLFGFADAGERTTFRQLIKVSGIGAKTALGILSALSSDELAQAVAQEDVKRLSSVPGIGKKTAERMILELRGKLAGSSAADTALFAAAAQDSRQDVVQTLMALGYSEKEAQAACKSLPDNVEVGEGVRQALKLMVK